MLQNQSWNNLDGAKKVLLHFDVTVFGGQLSALDRFLHNITFLGLIIDEDNGVSTAVPISMTIDIYIELPVVFEENSEWPHEHNHWNPNMHPLLSELPSLKVLVPNKQWIAIRQDREFEATKKIQELAAYLQLYRTNTLSAQTLRTVTPIVDKQAAIQIMDTYFPHRANNNVKMQFVNALWTYCKYLTTLASATAVIDGQPIILANDPQINYFMRNTATITKLMQLFIEEVGILVNEDKKLPDTCPITIINPAEHSPPVTFVFTNDPTCEKAKHFMNLNPQSYYLHTVTGVVGQLNSNNQKISFEHIRASAAPAFNINNTADFRKVLLLSKHVLTVESLLRLLHLNFRRNIGSSVIYEGETVSKILFWFFECIQFSYFTSNRAAERRKIKIYFLG